MIKFVAIFFPTIEFGVFNMYFLNKAPKNRKSKIALKIKQEFALELFLRQGRTVLPLLFLYG